MSFLGTIFMSWFVEIAKKSKLNFDETCEIKISKFHESSKNCPKICDVKICVKICYVNISWASFTWEKGNNGLKI